MLGKSRSGLPVFVTVTSAMVTGTRFGTMEIIHRQHGPRLKLSKEKFSNVPLSAQQIDF